jgi:hypothetical protein
VPFRKSAGAGRQISCGGRKGKADWQGLGEQGFMLLSPAAGGRQQHHNKYIDKTSIDSISGYLDFAGKRFFQVLFWQNKSAALRFCAFRGSKNKQAKTKSKDDCLKAPCGVGFSMPTRGKDRKTLF